MNYNTCLKAQFYTIIGYNMSLIIVHRLLQSFMLPPLNSMLILIFGFCLARQSKLISRTLIIIGMLTLYLQATPYFAYHLNKTLEFPPVKNDDMKKAEAIVVLGGGLNVNSFEYSVGAVVNPETLVRLNYTAYLARKYPNLPIITSGGYLGVRYTEGKVMRDTLLNNFNVTNQIWIEDSSRNTDENAKYVAQILLAKHITTVVVVSQAFHLRRACLVFRKYGLNPIPASTDYTYSTDALTPQLAFIPSASAMRYTARALHEIIGYWFYNL